MLEIGFLVPNRKAGTILSFVLVIFCWRISFAMPQKLDEPLQSLVLEGINKILLQQYNEAVEHFQTIARQYPNHPVGYLYHAATLETRAMDLNYSVDERVFDSLLTRAAMLSQTLPEVWRNYFLGIIDGYRAYHAAEREEWLSAFRYGSASASYFESALAIDSTFYDAYAGLGTYYFWKSEKTTFLTWLPFFEDKRGEGIRLLERAAERAEFNRYSAISSLISIYLEMQKYEEAEFWATRALKAYPRNRVFLWGKATALDRAKKYQEAVQAYERLLRSILDDTAAHPYNEIVCRLNLAKAKIALHDTAGVSSHLERILDYRNVSFPPAYKKRAQKKFEDAKTLLAAISGKQ